MDLSQLNSAEQAHMTKVIEKKQVRVNVRLLPCCAQARSRCKIFFACTLVLSRDASVPAVMTLRAKLFHQKRHVGPNVFLCQYFKTVPQEQCVQNCADKFLKHSERVGQRFAELNAGASIFLCPRSTVLTFSLEAMGVPKP